ncbi:uncharacterized protein LOC141604977 [Silene latifolia]|uniref:uncharacterized protein LOC141604977 n=1 Tax=Silene latifolia TaxID=37657 RepID=UPI003D773A17
MAETPKITQIFIKLFDNKTLTLQFPPQNPINLQSLTHQIQSLTEIPQNLQTLTLNGKLLTPTTSPILKIPNFSTLTLTIPLLGGKGGFGSLLRGAATKAGQKKTNNFDACRDMSGRRLRHVNAEKKMEEWAAEEAERNLEKKAEKYLKEMAKKGKGGKRDDGAEKYVEMYRLESARCVEEVERSVREAAAGMAVGGRKRKVVAKGGDGVDAKKLKIWKGKRKLGESDSDDSDGDTESDDSDAENEKSAVTDNGNQSDSSKDVSNGSISVPQSDQDQNGRGSSDSVSEEEKDILTGDSVETDATPLESKSLSNVVDPIKTLSDGEEKTIEKPCVSAEVALGDVDSSRSEPVDRELQVNYEPKTVSPEETIARNNPIVSEVPQPLNFDDFNSASELEVLGMERLKTELQERGLKCGGTLQERAARLFLLKTTPLEKLPKKLLAKK